MRLFDLFVAGVLIHFCALGLYLVHYIQNLEERENQ